MLTTWLFCLRHLFSGFFAVCLSFRALVCGSCFLEKFPALHSLIIGRIVVPNWIKMVTEDLLVLMVTFVMF